jgi:hypothetical protein
MRVYLQSQETNLFYDKNGEWVADRDQAEVFSSAMEAAMMSNKKQIKADVLLAFPDPKYDLRFPC